jgi:RNA polymerase sigma factor (sigma-70 family)
MGRNADEPAASSSNPVGSRRRSAASVSFEEFFDGEHERLFRALCMVTRDPHEAEELMQDAFVRVYERWDRVQVMDDPVGYLYRTAMNRLRQLRRRASVASRHRLRDPGGRDELASVEERDATLRALRSLSGRQRAVVVTIDMLGFTTDEVARMLGLRTSTVRVHLARARAALVEELRDDRP